MRQTLLLLAVTGLTSAGACAIGVRRLGLPGDRLGQAILGMCRFAGTAIVFLALNVAIGLAGVLLARGILGVFVSVYLLNDTFLPVLSVLQAVIFECWRSQRAAR
jgi:hypothetical protein